MHRSRSLGAPTRLFAEPAATFEHTSKGIPGYRGYIPGRGENCAGTFKQMADVSRANRCKAAFSRLEPEERGNNYREATWFERLPPKETITMPEYRGIDKVAPRGMEPAGDLKEARIKSGWKKATDHEDLGPPGHGAAVAGIVNYAGFLPGYRSENVYGHTWGRTRQLSVGAYFDASADKDLRRRAGLMDAKHPVRDPTQGVRLTKESTAVPDVDADRLREVPLHSNSYQDVRRGFSRCMYGGVDVDPAGRAAPFGRQDTFGRKKAPSPEKPHGYTGFVPGKLGQNVVGERICKTNEISKLLSYKNSIRVVQR